MSSMRFGISLRNAGPEAHEALVRLPQVAAELGLDTVWASDHVLAPPEIADHYGRTWLDPVVALTTVATRVPSIRVGISALVLPYRPALPTAKALSTLQAISGGRLVVAIGTGWSRQEYDALGLDVDARGRLTDEALDVLRSAWRRDDLEPGDPVPLLAAGNGPSALRRAATVGGWHPIALTPSQVAEGLATLPPRTRCVLRTRLGWGLERGDRPLFGTGKEIHRDIEAYAAAGVTELLLDHAAGSLDDAEVRLRLFCREMTRWS